MSRMDTDPSATTRATVDRRNPWPGLVPFSEDDRRFFRGRGPEIEELSRLVLRDRLTVLFGTSGLGKSSLLKAGLFPALRERQILPIYVRLDHSADRPALAEQIFDAIAAQATAAGAEVPRRHPGDSLWEHFHRRDADFWGPRNRPLVPLLAIDQFEEIFTLGRGDAAHREATKELIAELAWLAEGNAPQILKERLESDPEGVRQFDFSRHHYKLLISLREDYLAELEELRPLIPSLAISRLRLKRMTGRAAQRVVWLGAPHLIDLDLADPVVRFVARAGRRESLDEIQVEPALLSVVCRKLNRRRRERGEDKITANLLAGSQESILDEFYETSVKDLGRRMRLFIEDRLVTEDDHRDSVALGNALGLPGVTRQAIDKLIDRRLVRIEESAGSTRVELTHDLLVGAIAASRARRRRRRTRLLTSALGVAAVLLLIATLFGVSELFETRRRERDERRMRVAAELAPHDGARALSILLELESEVSEATDNPPALYPALAAAGNGSLDKDLAQIVGDDRASRSLFASAGGGLLASVAADHSVRVERPGSGEPPIVLAGAGSPILAAAFSPDGSRLAAGSGDGTTRVWSLDDEAAESEPVRLGGPRAPVLAVAYAPGGHRLAVGSGDGSVTIWNPRGDGEPLVLRGHQGPVHGVAFHPDGSRLVSASEDDSARIWDSLDGSLLATLPSDDDVWSAAYSRDGGRVVTASSDGLVRVWRGEGGDPIVLAGHRGPVVSAAFTPSGSRVVSASVDGTARLWSSDGYGAPVVMRAGSDPLTGATFDGDQTHVRVLTTSRRGTALIWPAAFDSIRDAVAALTSICLDQDFRVESLGESPARARAGYERCAASRGAPEDVS